MVVTSSFNIFLYQFWGSSGSAAIQVKDAPATFLAMLYNFQDLSSLTRGLTRGQTPAPGSESTKFWPLENQGIPNDGFRASDFNFRFCLNEDSCDPRSKILTQSHSAGLSSVQSSSVTQSCPTLGDPMNHSTPGLPVHHQLPESTQSHVHWVGDAIQPSHPLSSLLLLPSIFPSIRVFSNESVLHIRWPKYWSFSLNVSPSNEHPRLISFRMHWLDLLAVQRTLKSLSQHHSSKASILRCSAFFTVQLSYPYMTIGKSIALTRWTFVDKVMSLLFNMLSR